ncbi:MAG: hypothetical protein M3Y24_10305 [Acidobacteriota bacterium]|nr:hypothetical protein [Acidobacteriota bacterium]
MKAWLETRWRFTYALGLAALALAMAASGGGLGSTENAGRLTLVLSGISIFAAVYLAGAGIRTQSPFRRMPGLHGSTYFTLSLPVSRFRLLAIRAGLGLLETVGINVFMIVSAWGLFPLVRGNSTVLDLLRLIFAAIICPLCFYFVSTAVATVLDETWQMFGSLFVIGIAWWLVSRLALPPSVDVFRFMSGASPLLTHRLPWAAMAISLVASAVLFSTALKIVGSREY